MPFMSKISVPGNNASDIYQITVRGANMLLVVEEELTLIDTGYQGSAPGIIECIQQIGRKPEEIRRIILTHNHIDHVGGLAELKKLTQAKVTIHKSDIGVRDNLPSARPQDIDIGLEGGEVLDIMGGLEIIHTPGHTPGSISLFSPGNRLLIVGDAVKKRRDNLELPFKTAAFDLALAKASIKRMSALELDILCFGHGLPLSMQVQAKLQDLAARIGD